MELLGAEASSHRTLMDLLMFCFYAERNGKPLDVSMSPACVEGLSRVGESEMVKR